jgi:hypothetical protein
MKLNQVIISLCINITKGSKSVPTDQIKPPKPMITDQIKPPKPDGSCFA